MERKFELTCTHTVWSIVGCPFSLCRRPTSTAPIQISGKWLFENLTPPGKRLKTDLELQVRYFHLEKSTALKRKIKLEFYETGYTCWHISIYRKPRDWGLRATFRAPARIWLAVIDFQNGEQQSRSGQIRSEEIVYSRFIKIPLG